MLTMNEALGIFCDQYDDFCRQKSLMNWSILHGMSLMFDSVTLTAVTDNIAKRYFW